MKSIHINWLVFSHRYCVLLTLLLLSVEIKSAPAFDQNTDAAAGQQGQWQPQAEFGQPAQLGQSDWQQPQSSQNQMQQPQNQSGQSDWQQPQSSQNQWQQPQNQPGQSDWQQPQSSQNQWQQPQSQLGQSDWQQPGQNSFSQNNPNDADANSTFYGQAQETQALSPLPANNPNQQFNNSAPANFAQQNSLAQKNAKKENGKNSHTLKTTVGVLGRAMAVGAGIAAPLAGAYLMGRAINQGMPYGYGGGYGYPGTYPPMYGGGMGMGMPGYPPMMSPYRSPYGYGAGGLSSFMHY